MKMMDMFIKNLPLTCFFNTKYMSITIIHRRHEIDHGKHIGTDTFAYFQTMCRFVCACLRRFSKAFFFFQHVFLPVGGCLSKKAYQICFAFLFFVWGFVPYLPNSRHDTTTNNPLNKSTTKAGALVTSTILSAWVEGHTGGSRSIPTVHPCSENGGRLWVARKHHNQTSPMRTNHTRNYHILHSPELNIHVFLFGILSFPAECCMIFCMFSQSDRMKDAIEDVAAKIANTSADTAPLAGQIASSDSGLTAASAMRANGHSPHHRYSSIDA